jgi:hypothetical protein
LLGLAAGANFGLTAALMKGMTTTFAGGLGHLLTSWQIYGMIGAGAFGMFLVQSAMNAGSLLAAQPGLTMADPVLSVIWGVRVSRSTSGPAPSSSPKWPVWPWWPPRSSRWPARRC